MRMDALWATLPVFGTLLWISLTPTRSSGGS
jgi:hypothetical protein